MRMARRSSACGWPGGRLHADGPEVVCMRMATRGRPRMATQGRPRMATRGRPRMATRGRPRMATQGRPRMATQGRPRMATQGLLAIQLGRRRKMDGIRS